MVDVDVNERLYNWAHTPLFEVVQVEANNNEEYTSTKFKTVLGAIATVNGDISSQAKSIAVTISGATVTLLNSDLSNTNVTLILFGMK